LFRLAIARFNRLSSESARCSTISATASRNISRESNKPRMAKSPRERSGTKYD
jgi:hypothetical protein